MKIYTRTGDMGETFLIGGKRVPKNHPIVEAYGSIDETIALLGVIRSYNTNDSLNSVLIQLQDKLMACCTIIASENQDTANTKKINEADVQFIENQIDEIEAVLEPTRHFILPGAPPPGAFCHVARTVCRRAERDILKLPKSRKQDTIIYKFLNRLSDYLFVLGRKFSHDQNNGEIFWKV
jgi:cob(I)alamin adenosyltransferase